jgi:hypothetical protein
MPLNPPVLVLTYGEIRSVSVKIENTKISTAEPGTRPDESCERTAMPVKSAPKA